MEEELAQEIRNLIAAIKEDRKNTDEAVLGEIRTLKDTMNDLLVEIKQLNRNAEKLIPPKIYKEEDKPEVMLASIDYFTQEIHDKIDSIEQNTENLENNINGEDISDIANALNDSTNFWEVIFSLGSFLDAYGDADAYNIPINVDRTSKSVDEINSNLIDSTMHTDAIKDDVMDIKINSDNSSDKLNDIYLELYKISGTLDSILENMQDPPADGTDTSNLVDIDTFNNGVNDICGWIKNTHFIMGDCANVIIQNMPLPIPGFKPIYINIE